MLSFAAERLLRYGVVLFLVTFCGSMLLSLVPGSAALAVLGSDASPEAIADFNTKYGLNHALPVRYWMWLRGVFEGNLGESINNGQPVSKLLGERLPVTLELAILAIFVALLIAVPLALASAYRAGGIFDRIVQSLTSGLIAIPEIAMALFLVLIFAVKLNLFPVTGWVPFSEDPVQNLRFAVLPVAVLALPAAAVFLRVLRADVITTLQSDYIALARAKGISTPRILFKHALRASSYSLLTIGGLRLAYLIGGTVVVEVIFAIPGVGSALVSSIQGKDLIVLQGIVVVIASAYLVINFVIDMAYRFLDPRVEH
ncbi:ABC transporter permease [Amycolatopsis sp. GM8]|uniref:ABC transporter permease n=1 Tax=Amycolatopsis sp. GM8 TaxID=2896530 RepID=UPI001F18DA92|nr:ABC transporter permease [Amycolatopsis sp. GM8]